MQAVYQRADPCESCFGEHAEHSVLDCNFEVFLVSDGNVLRETDWLALRLDRLALRWERAYS